MTNQFILYWYRTLADALDTTDTMGITKVMPSLTAQCPQVLIYANTLSNTCIISHWHY